MSKNILAKKESESLRQYHVRLFSNLKEYEINPQIAAELLNKEFGTNYSESKWRKDYAQYYDWKDFTIAEYLIEKVEVKENTYTESTELKGDGSQSSDKLIKIHKGETLTPEYLLSAHGFDHSKFELVNAKNSVWNQSSDKTLYSSKISVKPRVNGFDIEKVIEKINAKSRPIYIDKTDVEDGENLLEIFLTDMHWGISLWDDYEKTMFKIIKRIRSKKWDTILFVIGSDILHNDGFSGQTTKGTIVDKVNMEQAWKDAFDFYCTLIEESIRNSKNVDGLFIDGNHDQAISWAFVKSLELKYPQVNFESEMKHRKSYVWNDIFLALSHGDKAKGNRLVSSILAEYGKELAKAKTKEIHSGHYHFEKSRDDFGIVTRTLSTAAKTDGYHYDNGFIGANKRFQLFEYSKEELESIYYV